MFAPSIPIRLSIPCPPVEYAITTDYKESPEPWPLVACKHGKLPPPHSNKHQFFCACIWERIPPPPEKNEPWSQEAKHHLSVLWFHCNLHNGYGENWAAAHYHECLSIVTGYRFEQHQVFKQLMLLRKDKASEWTDASRGEPDSPAVVAVFDKLNAKWIDFFSKFDIYSNMNLDELPEDFEGKPYHPSTQPAKATMMHIDMQKSALEKGLIKPLRLERVEWMTAIGDEDVADSDDEEEDKEKRDKKEEEKRFRDLERAMKGLRFKKNGVPIVMD
jgi:hypothetical protein